MKEQLVEFGEGNRFSGILSLSDQGLGPVVIFLNAGIVHKIGPNRLHVKLARQFASTGIDALRFDMTGLGETTSGKAGIGYEEQSLIDCQEAVDFMAGKFPDRPIIIFGICSGADNGYRAAVVDERISGLIMLDAYAYQNTTAKISDLAKRAQDPERWKRLVSKLASSGSEPVSVEEEIHEDDNDRIAPPKEEFGEDLQTITGRGGKLLMIYSSSVRHLINHKDQFQRSFKEFDFSGNLTVDVWADVDHTYTELKAQKKLTELLVTWLTGFKRA